HRTAQLPPARRFPHRGPAAPGTDRRPPRRTQRLGRPRGARRNGQPPDRPVPQPTLGPAVHPRPLRGRSRGRGPVETGRRTPLTPNNKCPNTKKPPWLFVRRLVVVESPLSGAVRTPSACPGASIPTTTGTRSTPSPPSRVRRRAPVRPPRAGRSSPHSYRWAAAHGLLPPGNDVPQ